MTSRTQTEPLKRDRDETDLDEVRGFLQFFVLLTRYIWPVGTACWCIAAWIYRCIPLSSESHGVIVYYPVCITGSLYLALVANDVGHRLQNKAPGAVAVAKKWLLLVLAWSVVWLALSPICGSRMSQIAEEAVYNLARTLVWFAIWFSYLCVSRRVRATYPDIPQGIDRGVASASKHMHSKSASRR